MSSHSVAPRRRFIFLTGVVPVLVTALVSIYRPPFFDRLDRASYDIVLRMAGTKTADPAVVIVDVDERSLATVGQWPWRRDVVGRLIAALVRASLGQRLATSCRFVDSHAFGQAKSPFLEFTAGTDAGIAYQYSL